MSKKIDKVLFVLEYMYNQQPSRADRLEVLKAYNSALHEAQKHFKVTQSTIIAAVSRDLKLASTYTFVRLAKDWLINHQSNDLKTVLINSLGPRHFEDDHQRIDDFFIAHP